MALEEDVYTTDTGDLPKFLVLGGCGFIGRHIVEFLLDKASKIFVIDKTLPEIAWLNEKHSAVFKDSKVFFQSANLITQNGCEKAFENIDEDIDFVINLASETRKGQSEPVYKEGIHKLSTNVIQHVEKKIGNRLKTYMEFSTSALYSSDKTPHKETDKIDLWSFEAKYKCQVEQDLAKSLKNYIIIRPAIVYGLSDRNSITPRLVVGGVYKHLKEMMKLPWTAELRLNTIHVEDLARATYHLCKHGKHGQIYNVVDKGETTQGTVSNIISEIFNINHDYYGTAFTTIAKMDIMDVLEDINDKHMAPWATICSSNGVTNTPLSPYIYSEALTKRHLSLDGSKLASTGFSEFKHPEITKELLVDVLNDFVQLNLFPKALLE